MCGKNPRGVARRNTHTQIRLSIKCTNASERTYRTVDSKTALRQSALRENHDPVCRLPDFSSHHFAEDRGLGSTSGRNLI